MSNNSEARETQEGSEESMEISSSTDSVRTVVEQPRVEANPDQENPKSSLLQLLGSGQHRIRDLCQEWRKFYGSSPRAALVQLIQLLVDASGSQYQIPPDQELPFNNSEILIAATVHFGNKSANYPLITRTGSAFTHNVCQFVQCLLRQLQSSGLILDESLVGSLFGFIQVCANSKVRAFRHTCTLIALKMMSGLNDMVSLESDKLEDLWTQFFKGVFFERLVDMVDEIRSLCLHECGLWLEKYPQCYLDSHHVKYLFQALQDKSTKVIECSFQAIFRLLKNPDLQAVCLEQGVKYRTTLMGLTMSPENELTQVAIELIGNFYKADAEFLDESMLQVIETLVFAAHRGVAQAAAKLASHRFQDSGTDEEHILQLARFFVQFGEHEHAAYLVDAYYGHSETILAWSAMVGILVQPDALSSAETSAIIEILTRAVQQAVTGEIPPGRYTEDLVRKILPNAKKRISRAIFVKFPELLQLYRSRSQDLRNLLQLPQFMLLQSVQFEAILEQIKNIMFEQQDVDVLEMGAKTLEHVYSLNASHGKHCKELLEKAVYNYQLADTAWEKSKDNGKSLIDALSLLSVLYARFDLYDWELSDDVVTKLESAVAEREETEEACLREIISLYLKIVYVSLSWDLRRVKEAVKAQLDVTEKCRGLRRRLDTFLSVSFQLVEHSSPSVGSDAFGYVCDVFVLFADPLRQSSCIRIRALECRTNICDYELMEAFTLRFVFGDGSGDVVAALTSLEDFQMLQIKRRVLASYCKLVFHNIVPVMRFCIMLQYYERFNPLFGDIMRATMERCLDVNPTNFGMTLMHTCLLVYKRIRLRFPDAGEAAASSDFADLLKLAESLADLLYIKPLRVRSAVLVLHRAGIRFAVELVASDDPLGAPEHLLYLMVLQKFVPQLLAQDVLDVLQTLQLIEYTVPNDQAEKWQPLLGYRNALELAVLHSCRRDDFYNLTSFVVD